MLPITTIPRGARHQARASRRKLVFGRSVRIATMMQSCASAAKEFGDTPLGSRGSDPRLLGLTMGWLLDRTFGGRPRASRIVHALGLDQPSIHSHRGMPRRRCGDCPSMRLWRSQTRVNSRLCCRKVGGRRGLGNCPAAPNPRQRPRQTRQTAMHDDGTPTDAPQTCDIERRQGCNANRCVR